MLLNVNLHVNCNKQCIDRDFYLTNDAKLFDNKL